MSRKGKLIRRFQSRPKDFTWEELQRLLEGFGYQAVQSGKTGGSRRRFIHVTAAPIMLHKPHPGNIIKMYIVDDVMRILQQEGFL